MFAKRRIFCVLTVAATLAFAGCGFKLRGSGIDAVLPFKTMYVALPETSSLGTELRRNISGGGTTRIAANAKVADGVVEVLSETRNKEILSLNSQGRVREYALYYNVVFRVLNGKGAELLPPTTVALKRILSFNESEVLAKEKEEATLYRDMQSDAVRQILRRIAALAPTMPAPGKSDAPAPSPAPAVPTAR